MRPFAYLFLCSVVFSLNLSAQVRSKPLGIDLATRENQVQYYDAGTGDRREHEGKHMLVGAGIGLGAGLIVAGIVVATHPEIAFRGFAFPFFGVAGILAGARAGQVWSERPVEGSSQRFRSRTQALR